MEDTRHPGFTLVELLVTLSIMALLAGLAVPAMARWIDGHRLHGAAETLVQELRQARNHAITHQQTVTVRFAGLSLPRWCIGWTDRNDCNCFVDYGQAGACTTGPAASPRSRYTRFDHFPGTRLSAAQHRPSQTLRFSSTRGSATAGTLRISNRAGIVKIVVSPLGRVRACSLKGTGFAPC